MWEFEFYDPLSNEHSFYFGYSFNDLEARYPNVDFGKLVPLGREYID
jgi:hypothetical protein